MPQHVHPLRPEDIHSLSDFLRNHKSHVDRLTESGRPELLTVNGRAKLVVLDANAYQRLFELADQLETLRSVREGLDSLERGEGISLDELDRRIRERHNLPHRGGATGTDGP